MKYIFIIFCLSSWNISVSQQVTVSREISIRNDYAFDILGKIEDRLLLYRDNGRETKVELYDEDLKFLFDRELVLPHKKATKYGVTKTDSSFIVFSGFRNKKKYSLYAHQYDKNIDPTDTVALILDEEDFKLKNFEHFVSPNKSKTLLLSTEGKDFLHIYVIDNIALEILWKQEIRIPDFNPFKDLKNAFIEDNGEVNVLLFDPEKEAKKDESQFMIVGATSEDVFINRLKVDKKYIIDAKFKIDSKNQRIILAGLSSDDRIYDADSYFFLSKDLSTLEEYNDIAHRDFDSNFITEIYGKILGRKKTLNDFQTRDIIVRNDGGIVLVTEMYKEFYRRSSFNSVSVNSQNRGRGWVDINVEDIILIALDSEGKEEWKRILYKKQFSQDDDGVFSSFFTFKNSSRLRLIYNDEVKKNITVSEYVLDPLGNYERNSLLNTQYQNLKIRWKDAVQISPTELIVPSQNNYLLSLVKVVYI